MSLPQDKLDEHFLTEEKDGEVLIYPKDEGQRKPLLCGKSRTGKSLGERDGCCGYPLEDLRALWYFTCRVYQNIYYQLASKPTF